jgi:hypothetical protein
MAAKVTIAAFALAVAGSDAATLRSNHAADAFAAFEGKAPFPSPFLREVSLSPSSRSRRCNTGSKVAALCARLAASPGPQIVYSHFLDQGLHTVASALPQGTRAAMLTGDTPTEAREAIVKEFNAGRLDVLLLSDAAKEGVDLKDTHTVHVRIRPPPHPPPPSSTRALFLPSQRSEVRQVLLPRGARAEVFHLRPQPR